MALVGVRFRPTGRVHYFDSAGIELAVGDRVLVDTESGPREGRVVIASGQVVFSELRGPVDRVLRKVEDR